MDMYQLNQIPTEAQITKYIRQIVFGKHIHCPHCKSRQTYSVQGRYRCRKCRVRFSLLSHTWLKNMKVPLQQFWLILWCWTTQIPVRQTVSLTQMSEVTIRHWFEEFRHHLPYNNQVLDRMVQLDEAYFGGHNGKALMMAKEVGTRKLAYVVLPHTSPVREHAAWFLESYVVPHSQLHTDGAAIYKEIDQWWPIYHSRDIHKKFEFELTSEIEGMFGVLRTFIRRMYHHVTVAKLGEYVGEFCYRFSHPEVFESPYQYLLISLSAVPIP
jgi:transposase-like protein